MGPPHDGIAASWIYRLRTSPTFILFTVCVAIFNDVFLFGSLIPVLPFALPEILDVQGPIVQIYISVLLAAYGAAVLIGSLLFGWIGDRLKRRHAIFLSGLIMLLLATAALGFGRHVAVLALGRLFQGFAASITWTSGLALLTDIIGEDRFGEAIGYAQTAVSIGTTSAPLLGGIIYAHAGYTAVSAMGMGTVGFSVILGLTMIEPIPSIAKQNDSATRTNGYGTAQAAMNGAEEYDNPSGSDSDESTTLLKQKKDDKISSRPAYLMLLRSGRVLANMAGLFCYNFGIISFENLIPMYVKDTFHWDSTHVALIFLCWIIPGFLGPIAGKTSDRIGPRWVAVAGFAWNIVPLVCLRFVANDSNEQKALFITLLTLVGLGLVWIPSPCISDLSAAAADLKRQRPKDFGNPGAQGQAFGLFVFAFALGALIGPPVSGVLKAKGDWGMAMAMLAVVSALATIPIMFKTSATPRRLTNFSEAPV